MLLVLPFMMDLRMQTGIRTSVMHSTKFSKTLLLNITILTVNPFVLLRVGIVTVCRLSSKLKKNLAENRKKSFLKLQKSVNFVVHMPQNLWIFKEMSSKNSVFWRTGKILMLLWTISLKPIFTERFAASLKKVF